MPYTDVIIVGNEPFIESAPSDWNEPLNSFYSAACERTNSYLTNNKIAKPIFLGAFESLFLPDRQNHAGYTNLLAFAKSTPYIAGVDLHIHHGINEEMVAALNFAKGRIREDQKILVTEFSLMHHWRNNNNTNITPAFIAAANVSPTDKIFPPPVNLTKNYQYIDYALKNPRPVEEWNDLGHRRGLVQVAAAQGADGVERHRGREHAEHPAVVGGVDAEPRRARTDQARARQAGRAAGRS